MLGDVDGVFFIPIKACNGHNFRIANVYTIRYGGVLAEWCSLHGWLAVPGSDWVEM